MCVEVRGHLLRVRSLFPQWVLDINWGAIICSAIHWYQSSLISCSFLEQRMFHFFLIHPQEFCIPNSQWLLQDHMFQSHIFQDYFEPLGIVYGFGHIHWAARWIHSDLVGQNGRDRVAPAFPQQNLWTSLKAASFFLPWSYSLTRLQSYPVPIFFRAFQSLWPALPLLGEVYNECVLLLSTPLDHLEGLFFFYPGLFSFG